MVPGEKKNNCNVAVNKQRRLQLAAIYNESSFKSGKNGIAASLDHWIKKNLETIFGVVRVPFQSNFALTQYQILSSFFVIFFALVPILVEKPGLQNISGIVDKNGSILRS